MNRRSHRRSRYIWRLSIILAFIFVFPVAMQPSEGSAGLADLPYRLVPGLTSSVGVQLSSLATSDALIVWEDHRGGDPDVYAYDINDAREFRASRSSDQRRQPAVSGSVIVWISGEDPFQSTVRGIDLAEGIEFGVTSEPSHVKRPAVSGGLIAWQERADGRWVVRAVERGSGDAFTLGELGDNAARPGVSGSRIVWQEHDGESWNIMLYDLDSGSQHVLTDSLDDDQYPVIASERIAFVRTFSGGGTPELVVIDLEDGTEHSIATGHFFMSPSVHGDIVVWEDWRSGLPDVYAFDLAHDEMFAVARSQQAATPVVSERIIAWISGSDLSGQRVQVLGIQQRLPTDPQEPPAVASPDRLFVPETQHFVSSGFKAFWQAHGGPLALGYPLTEEFLEEDPETGREIVVQYFERVKLEFHPDAGEGDRVKMALLGIELRPEREAPRTEPTESNQNQRYFDQTGHSIRGGFKGHWEQNGGLEIFGYPITGEFVENGRTVQYFERARFEFIPEAPAGQQVRLGLLGREALQARGWLPLPPVDTTQIFE